MSHKAVTFLLAVVMGLGLALIPTVFDWGPVATAHSVVFDDPPIETGVILPAGAVTIQHRIQIGDEPPAGGQILWLTGFKTEPEAFDTSEIALGVSFAPVNSGWFGTMWGLHLVSEVGLIERGQVSDGSTYPEGASYTSLRSGPPRWGHEYEVTLSYDPQTGAGAVIVHDVTSDETVLGRNMQLRPFSGTLYAHTNASHLRHGFVPAPVQWWLVQPDESNERFLPAASLDRRKEAALSLNFPWSDLPGRWTWVLTDDTGQELVVVGVDPDQDRTTISVADLPAGRYKSSLHYDNGSQSWVIDEKSVFVGSVTGEISRLEMMDVGHAPHIQGVLTVTADGPFDRVTLGVETSLSRHGFTYDPVQGRGVMSESIAWDAWTPVAIVDLKDQEIEVDFHLPLPAIPEGEPGDFWELVVRPSIDPDDYLAGTRNYRTWIATTSVDEWRPFLQDEEVDREQIVPGIEWLSVKGRSPAGPLELHLVTVDLSHPSVSVDALVGSDLTTPAASRWPRSQPSQMVAGSGAKVGINADFFDIRDSMVPRGIVLQSGNLLKAETTGYVSVGFTRDATAYIGFWRWQGAVVKVDGSEYRALHGLNPQRPAQGLSLFRSPALSSFGTADPQNPVVELVLEEMEVMDEPDVHGRSVHGSSDHANKVGRMRGIVREIRIGEPKVPLSPGWMVLSGGGEQGRYLSHTFEVGDQVDIVYDIVGPTEWPYLEEPFRLYGAVAGNVLLLREGKYGDRSQLTSDKVRHPRTAIGISWDQRTLYILVVDGRSKRSIGMTYQELADFFRHVGAFHAINLDGGGSSALVVNERMNGPMVLNVPSDGRQRFVPVGLGVFWMEND